MNGYAFPPITGDLGNYVCQLAGSVMERFLLLSDIIAAFTPLRSFSAGSGNGQITGRMSNPAWRKEKEDEVLLAPFACRLSFEVAIVITAVRRRVCSLPGSATVRPLADCQTQHEGGGK